MTAVDPQPAASVALVRDAAVGLEVFMMRRAATMAFAPGMYVFPGGRLDPVDLADGAAIAGYPFARDTARASADEPLLRGLVACALREVGEESGVALSAADLHLVDHWVTPEHSRLRYDVRFFAASVPVGQQPRAIGTEMDQVLWVEPAQALADSSAGRMPMLIPTLRMLEFLSSVPSVAALAAAALERDIRPRLPRPADSSQGAWHIVDAYRGDILESPMPAHPIIEGGDPS